MSKTNLQCLTESLGWPDGSIDGIENKAYSIPIRVVLSAMTAAREDELEKMRLLITNEIFFLSDKPDSKDRWAINRLNKLLNDLSCT